MSPTSGPNTPAPSRIFEDAVYAGELLDLNQASATEIASWTGLTPRTAAALVEERRRRGAFAGADDLTVRVPETQALLVRFESQVAFFRPAVTSEARAAVGRLFAVLERVIDSVRGAHPALHELCVYLPGLHATLPNLGAAGTYSPARWRRPPRISVCTRYVMDCAPRQGAERLLEVFLHELAHAVNDACGIKDTSNDVHLPSFASRARSLGLRVSYQNEQRGEARTSLTPECRREHGRALSELTILLEEMPAEAFGALRDWYLWEGTLTHTPPAIEPPPEVRTWRDGPSDGVLYAILAFGGALALRAVLWP